MAAYLSISGAADADADRAGCAVPWQPHHPHVVAKVLATELGPDASSPRQLVDFLLQLQITERSPVVVTCAYKASFYQIIPIIDNSSVHFSYLSKTNLYSLCF